MKRLQLIKRLDLTQLAEALEVSPAMVFRWVHECSTPLESEEEYRKGISSKSRSTVDYYMWFVPSKVTKWLEENKEELLPIWNANRYRVLTLPTKSYKSFGKIRGKVNGTSTTKQVSNQGAT